MINIPPEILEIYEKLNKKFDVYFVGGSVRGALAKRSVHDWDLTTDATPQEILKVFPNGFYDNNFGTVGIPMKDNIVEITTFRTEVSFSPTHKPDQISWGKTIEEDLARRDFTINAIALKLEKDKQKIVDPYGGEKDLEKKIIRAVGDPTKRFKEDALRLIRAIRIATQLGFTIEETTWQKIVEDNQLIQNISAERIRVELLKIMASHNASDGVLLLKNSGLLNFIIPELLQGVDVSQTRPGRHHTSDVFTHNVLSLKFCPSKDEVVKFATLLHDIGKPMVKSLDKDGLVIFHNHEVIGAKLAKDICERLRFSNKEKDKIITLIRWHMFSVNENQTDAAVRRFIRRIGVENVRDMMDLRVGDRLGGGTQTAESWRLKLFKEKIEEQLKPLPFSINDLAVDGNDVMKILKLKPGPVVGKILEELFKEVDEDLSKNNKAYLEQKIKKLKKMVK